MGNSDDETTPVPATRIQGGLRSTQDGRAEDYYETGSISGVHNQGTYYDFDKTFTGTPDVTLTGIATGTATVFLSGTPATGSFRADVDRAGSFDAMYTAVGPR